MTSTDLARNEEESSLEVLPPSRPPAESARHMLLAHAEMMDTAYRLAKPLVDTAMVPARFRGKAEDATAAILYGAELGLNPIQSLQRIIPIHGMPSLEARTMVALLKSRGYKVRTTAQTDDSVTVQGIDLEGDVYEATWTLERARKAGYVPEKDERTGKYKTNANGKLIGNEKYLTDPQAMLKAKAQAEVCRDMAPDVLLGISYTSEELESERFNDAAPQRAKPKPITVEEIFGESEKTTPAAAPEPLDDDTAAARVEAVAKAQADLETADEAEPADPEPHPGPDPEPPVAEKYPTRWQNQMHALFVDADIDKDNREDRLLVTMAILGRTVESSNDLTPAEAKKLIDTLNGWKKKGELGAQVTEILNAATLLGVETEGN